MLAKGIDPREVWKKTGTMRGVDNQLRQEIPDNAAQIKGLSYKGREGVEGSGKLTTMLDHQGMFDAYPDTANIQSSIAQGAKGPEFGSYSNDGPEYSEFFPQLQASAKNVKSPVLHELQHAIQQREGWARGGSPDDFMPEQTVNDARVIAARIAKGETPSQAAKWLKENLGRTADVQVMDLAMQDPVKLFSYPSNPDLGYRRLAGEAEARLTQARMDMNMDERLASYPYDMLDVPMDQLIVRGLLGQ
jgi:hypothetical protein